MASAATAWLDSLSAAQRRLAQFPAPDEAGAEDRLRWFYTPTDHGGLTLHPQRPRQQGLAMRLVASGLSYEGYTTVCAILGAENILDRLENFAVDWGRERGRDPQLFFLRVFGDPARDRTWAWRFGGHHVSLNHLVADGHVVSMTPSFLGLDPAESSFPGDERLRPLGGYEDVARSLLCSLEDGQRSRAVMSDRAVSDIVSGNRAHIRDGDQMIHMQDLWHQPFDEHRLVAAVEQVDLRAEAASGFDEHDHLLMALTDVPKGLAASAMSEGQRATLRHLISLFHGRVPTELSTVHRAFYADDRQLDLVHFAWGGPAGRGLPHYFRVQGPQLLLEYDNTQRDGNHAHSVWRDPTADFGLALPGSLG
jgi:hypothetical protein